MTGTLKNLCTFGLLAAVLSGCASVPQDAGFDNVRNLVAERTGQRVQWLQGGPEDQAVADTVQAMLKQELTVDQTVQIALLNNRRLQATYEDLGLAQVNLVQAGLLRNPVFNAGILFLRGAAPADLEFSVVQDFLSILYRPLRRSIAEAEFEAAKFKVAGAVLDLAGQVRAAFYRTQAQEQTVEFLNQVVEATGAAYDAAKRLHEAGNITDLALANERALSEDARLALTGAKLELATGRERLNVLMGLWGTDTQWKMNPRLPEITDESPDLADMERRAIAANLDLAAQRKQIEGLAKLLGLTNATALIPQLDLGAAFIRDDGIYKRGPTLGLEIPLFDQGQARVAAAQSGLRRMQQNYTALATEIRSAARATAQAIEVTRAQAQFMKNVILPTRTKIVNDTLLQYNAMQVGIFQLLLAQQQQISAGRQYIETLRNYWLARTGLGQILNGRISDVGFSAGSMMDTAGLTGMQTGGH